MLAADETPVNVLDKAVPQPAVPEEDEEKDPEEKDGKAAAGAARVCQIVCARGFSLSGTGCLSGVLCSRYLIPWCPVYPAALRNRTYRCFRGQMLRGLFR